MIEGDKKGGKTMFSNLYISEKLMFERAKERQREIEQQHLLAGLHRSHPEVLSSRLEVMVFFVSAVFREKAVTVQYLRFLVACCLWHFTLFWVWGEILL